MFADRGNKVIADVNKAIFDVRCMGQWGPTVLRVGYLNRYDGTGTVIRRIPLFDDDGQIEREYYAFWIKDRTNAFTVEFADILKKLFRGGRIWAAFYIELALILAGEEILSSQIQGSLHEF